MDTKELLQPLHIILPLGNGVISFDPHSGHSLFFFRASILSLLEFITILHFIHWALCSVKIRIFVESQTGHLSIEAESVIIGQLKTCDYGT